MHICYLDLNLINAAILSQAEYTRRARQAIAITQRVSMDEVVVKMLPAPKLKLVWSNK